MHQNTIFCKTLNDKILLIKWCTDYQFVCNTGYLWMYRNCSYKQLVWSVVSY